MKKFWAIAVLICLACTLGISQEASKVQVFGGYQFTSADTAGLTDRQSFNGWDSDVAVRISNHISLVGNVSGTYKTLSMDTFVPVSTTPVLQPNVVALPHASIDTIEPKLRMYSFMTGPRFTFTKGKFSPFAQMTFGINHLAVTASDIGGLSIGKNGFGMTVGGGLDLNAGNKFAFRLVKFDYMLHHLAVDSSLLDVNVS